MAQAESIRLVAEIDRRVFLGLEMCNVLKWHINSWKLFLSKLYVLCPLELF